MFSKTIKVCFGYPQSEYLNKIKVLLHFPVVSVGDVGVWWKLSWNITKMESRDQCDWEMDWIYFNFISINWTLINFRPVSETLFTYVYSYIICLFQREWILRLHLPDQRGGYQHRPLHLHPSRCGGIYIFLFSSDADNPSVSQSVFTITKKARTRAFSWLKAPTSTIKTLC